MKTKHLFLWSLVAVLGVAGCSNEEDPAAPDPDADSTRSDNPITAPADYVGAVGRAQQRVQKTASTVSLQNAISAYQIQEGRFPKTLEELVSGEYLSRLPEPPAGMKFEYDPATGKVSVVAD